MAIYTVTLNTAIDVAVDEKEYFLSGLRTGREIPAGKGINVSRAFKSVGIKSTAIAIVGMDDIELFESIADEFITTLFVRASGSVRRNITLTDCKDGLEHHERTEGYRSSEEEFKEVYDILINRVSEGDWVIFSGSIPKGIPTDAYKRLISLCKNKGAYTLLDTSDEALMVGIQASPYAIKPNLEELDALNGNPFESRNEIELFVKKIASTFDIHIVLATLAGDGGLIFSFDDRIPHRMQAYEFASNPMSTVGCGDCCVAGLISGLLDHLDSAECLERAMHFAYLNTFTEVPGELIGDSDK